MQWARRFGGQQQAPPAGFITPRNALNYLQADGSATIRNPPPRDLLWPCGAAHQRGSITNCAWVTSDAVLRALRPLWGRKGLHADQLPAKYVGGNGAWFDLPCPTRRWPVIGRQHQDSTRPDIVPAAPRTPTPVPVCRRAVFDHGEGTNRSCDFSDRIKPDYDCGSALRVTIRATGLSWAAGDKPIRAAHRGGGGALLSGNGWTVRGGEWRHCRVPIASTLRLEASTPYRPALTVSPAQRWHVLELARTAGFPKTAGERVVLIQKLMNDRGLNAGQSMVQLGQKTYTGLAQVRSDSWPTESRDLTNRAV